ncbi:hypothetical protein BDQ17DRAFT_1331605 [Cyathus striatus]|nr:hypothetical protein BDQ17DRAFT_1331605 [Cyathus striatus]
MKNYYKHRYYEQHNCSISGFFNYPIRHFRVRERSPQYIIRRQWFIMATVKLMDGDILSRTSLKYGGHTAFESLVHFASEKVWIYFDASPGCPVGATNASARIVTEAQPHVELMFKGRPQLVMYASVYAASDPFSSAILTDFSCGPTE